MSLSDGVWRLWRDATPPAFSQRFSRTFSADGNTITGSWEIAHRPGRWEHDFNLIYTRIA